MAAHGFDQNFNLDDVNTNDNINNHGDDFGISSFMDYPHGDQTINTDGVFDNIPPPALPQMTVYDTHMEEMQTMSQQQEQRPAFRPPMQQGPPTTMPNAAFWGSQDIMQLQTGVWVFGTHQELYGAYEELRSALIEKWVETSAMADMGSSMAEDRQSTPASNPTPAQPVTPPHQLQHEYGNLQISSKTFAPPGHVVPGAQQQVYRDAQTRGKISSWLGYAVPKAQQQGYGNLQTPYGTFSSPGSVIPEAQQPSYSPTPATASAVTPSTGAKRKRANATAAMTLPPYQTSPDLNSAADAREYLSRFDINESTQLNLLGDDFAAVQVNIHTHAAKVYAALLHPYDSTIAFVRNDRKQKYLDQQDIALATLQKTLLNPTRLKAAKASSILMVDAAITLHKHGVSRDRLIKHNNAVDKDLKPDDGYKISTSLRCSERVNAIVAAIRANKLVAKDVLEQKNFLRFAESPDSYVARKLMYLRSNNNRQDKVDSWKEEEVARTAVRPARSTAKRGRARYAENEDEEYDDEC